MWRRVHDQPEVFALLSCIYYLFSGQGLLEGGCRRSDLSKDDLGIVSRRSIMKKGKTNIIFLCHDIVDRLANGMFLQETDNARNFRDLRDISNFRARANWTRPDLRHGAESCAELLIASWM